MTFDDIRKELEYKYEQIIARINNQYKRSIEVNKDFHEEILSQ